MDLKSLMDMAGKDSEDSPDKEKIKAKMEVIEDLRRMASDMMGEGMADGLKKVTVASDSPEGLMEGLEKAEDVVEDSEDMMMADDEESYDPGDEYEEGYESPEDIEAKIQELMELKAKMME